MLVYRIEHPETRGGPYCGARELDRQAQNGLASIVYRHSDLKRTPSPMNDGTLFAGRGFWGVPSRDYVFGFASLADMRRWFTREERHALKALGFVLAIYRSDDVEVGNRQVAFIRGESKPLSTHPIIRNKRKARTNDSGND